MSLFLKRQADREPEETILDFVLQPIIENEGNVTGIFVQGQDVTEQQRNESELQRYREHLELVRERTTALEQSEAERQVAEQALQQGAAAGGGGQADRRHRARFQQHVADHRWQPAAPLRRSLGGDETAARRLDSAVSGVEKGARLASQLRLLAFASRQPLLPRQGASSQLLEQMHELLNGALGSAVQLELEVLGRPAGVRRCRQSAERGAESGRECA